MVYLLNQSWHLYSYTSDYVTTSKWYFGCGGSVLFFFFFTLFSSDNLQNQDSFVGRGSCFVFWFIDN